MKVLVGLSGGLDSTYAALKLINEGHEVEGAVVIMHEYTEIDAAKRTADQLGIALHTIDATGIFQSVKDNFVSEYSRGRTPNPCIVCNPLVKFRALADFAKQNGFDRIATGHYANIIKNVANGKIRYALSRSKDLKKDQTYMLYRLPQDILSVLMLPLGDEIKDEVREKAKSLGLEAADRKESQEICFIPNGDYYSYIEGIKGVFPEGNFVLSDNTVIGRHKGIIRYTVGQRKGLGISYGERIFVSRIDAEKNEIILSAEGSLTTNVAISDIVFSGLSEQDIGKEIRADVKLRYLAKPVSATVVFSENRRAEIKLDIPQKAVTPGQSAVIYDKEQVLFGGFID